MAGKKNELGPTGRTVAENVKRLRERQNLTFAEVARRLEATGRPIPVLGLGRIEKGERRVDADDLMALAVALEVAPLALLMPESKNRDDEVEATGHTGRADQIFRFLRGDYLPDAGDDWHRQFRFSIDSRPPWAVADGLKQMGSANGDD